MSVFTEVLLAMASACIVLMTIMVIVSLVYLKNQIAAMEKSFTTLKNDVEKLVSESRIMVNRVNEIAAKVEGQMADIQHVTTRARAWADRADRIVDSAGPLIETPLFFLSGKFKVVQSFLHGVLHALKNPQ